MSISSRQGRASLRAIRDERAPDTPPLARAFERVLAWIRTRPRMRRDARELQGRDDRLLADIGLTRSEVEQAIRHGRLPPP